VQLFLIVIGGDSSINSITAVNELKANYALPPKFETGGIYKLYKNRFIEFLETECIDTGCVYGTIFT
jgi:hypothetical protein